MSLAFLFPYSMLNMLRMLIHPSSGACDLFVELFQWVVYPDAGFQPASGYHTTPAKPQRNTNTHRTRAIQPIEITQHISRKLLRMDVLTSATC